MDCKIWLLLSKYLGSANYQVTPTRAHSFAERFVIQTVGKSGSCRGAQGDFFAPSTCPTNGWVQRDDVSHQWDDHDIILYTAAGSTSEKRDGATRGVLD